jgi:multidrug efflux system membrane fusion protein
MTKPIAVLTGVLLALSVAACRQPPAEEKVITPVRVETVDYYAEAPGVRYSGTIEPNRRVDVAFKVGGYIQAIARVEGRDIQEGDRVTRDMVLAEIRPSDYEQKVRQARSQLAEAEAGEKHTKETLDRATQLFNARSLTKADLDQAQAAYDTVQAKLSGARALVQEAENAKSDATLVSPIDGVVMKRLIEVGSLAGPGTPGFVLADTQSVKMVFGASDLTMRALRIGMPQTIVTEAVPGREFHGRTTRISPLADPKSRVFDVEVTVPNPDGVLKVGMVASLSLTPTDRPAPSLVVPLSAVLRAKDDPSGYAVYVVQDQGGQAVARLRNVKLGDVFGNQVAVLEGVRRGERVIVAGSTIVVDGEPVRLMS